MLLLQPIQPAVPASQKHQQSATLRPASTNCATCCIECNAKHQSTCSKPETAPAALLLLRTMVSWPKRRKNPEQVDLPPALRYAPGQAASLPRKKLGAAIGSCVLPHAGAKSKSSRSLQPAASLSLSTRPPAPASLMQSPAFIAS